MRNSRDSCFLGLREEVWLRGISNDPFEAALIPAFRFRLGSRTYTWDVMVAEISDDILIGSDFLARHGCVVDFRRNTFGIQGEIVIADAVQVCDSASAVRKVVLTKRHTLSPVSSVILSASVCHP